MMSYPRHHIFERKQNMPDRFVVSSASSPEDQIQAWINSITQKKKKQSKGQQMEKDMEEAGLVKCLEKAMIIVMNWLLYGEFF